ncbi:DUF262 domain-containing protein [Anaerotruncus colihominis]|jgi:hypothetical protein|uniref:DUF262 domain-containing protein n=1 Tax=Anaerotruncus colihominis TaxID=169435 RepID=A0A845SZA7_9FIRM|nr:DUF262 domain-containing protein [Anaerotruncus colihominis]MCR2024196.1 DUF262 domain-containing protein [Anaerotruncus colihominis]NDO39257.1 DUF262 domain-containing protein [Anaerotruncus colihominis]
MAKFFERNSTKLTISEFYDNYKLNKYNFQASYQRKSDVWAEDKKAFLIDSILKNYPIPAIFMRPIVDDSGRTQYDIVDGKQRLQAIIGFIEGRISLTSYFAEDSFLGEENRSAAEIISGKTFEEIKKESASEYIKQFWTYTLQIEYLYEENVELVSSVFDRLNRNGEPLNPQELRNAKYSNTQIMPTIHKLACNDYLKDKMERLKIERMEDEEFISELLFLVLDGRILDSSPAVLDEKYEQYKNEDDALKKGEQNFLDVVEFIKQLDLDYDKYKRLFWTTHLYTLFSVAWYCVKYAIDVLEVKKPMEDFYTEYFSKSTKYEGKLKEYKDASSSRTRSAIQRNNRMKAILDYCGVGK